MVKLELLFKADLENIVKLTPTVDKRWFIKTRCSNCGHETKDWIYLSLEETFPISGSRGKAHYVAKCHECKRENSIEILQIGSYVSENSGQFQSLAQFDCRGLEIIDYDPRSGFVAECVSSHEMVDTVEFQEGDWTYYDESSKQSVGIYGVKTKFRKAK